MIKNTLPQIENKSSKKLQISKKFLNWHDPMTLEGLDLNQDPNTAFNSNLTKGQINYLIIPNLGDSFSASDMTIMRAILQFQNSRSGRCNVTNKSIAFFLGIKSERTVERHLSSIRKKLEPHGLMKVFHYQIDQPGNLTTRRQIYLNWEGTLEFFNDSAYRQIVGSNGYVLISSLNKKKEIKEKIKNAKFKNSEELRSSSYSISHNIPFQNSSDKQLLPSDLKEDSKSERINTPRNEIIEDKPSREEKIGDDKSNLNTPRDLTCGDLYPQVEEEKKMNTKSILGDLITDGKYGPLPPRPFVRIEIPGEIKEEEIDDKPLFMYDPSDESKRDKEKLFYDNVEDLPEDCRRFLMAQKDPDSFRTKIGNFTPILLRFKMQELGFDISTSSYLYEATKLREEEEKRRQEEEKITIARNKALFNDDRLYRASNERNKILTRAKSRRDRIVNFEKYHEDWEEICKKEKCSLVALKSRMHHNELYEPDEDMSAFDHNCHPRYGFMSNEARDREFVANVSYWLSAPPYGFSARNLNMFARARKRADELRVTYDDWCAAIYDKIGPETIYYTHFAAKFAEEIVIKFIDDGRQYPIKVKSDKVIEFQRHRESKRKGGGRKYTPRKTLDEQFEQFREDMANYCKEEIFGG